MLHQKEIENLPHVDVDVVVDLDSVDNFLNTCLKRAVLHREDNLRYCLYYPSSMIVSDSQDTALNGMDLLSLISLCKPFCALHCLNNLSRCYESRRIPYDIDPGGFAYGPWTHH